MASFSASPAIVFDPTSQNAAKIMEFFDRNKKSPNKMAQLLINYVNLANQQALNGQGVIFDDTNRGKDSILEQALREADQDINGQNDSESFQQGQNKEQSKTTHNKKIPISEGVHDLDSLLTRNKEAQNEFANLIENIHADLGGELKFRKGMKKSERIIEKVKSDYNGDFSCVVDVLGASLVFENEQDMFNALFKLQDIGI